MIGAAWARSHLRRTVVLPGRWLLMSVAIIGVVGGGGVVVGLPRQLPAGGPSHFADAADPELVAAGAIVYAGNCASCHGRRLQGQALWQLVDEYAGRRAPAHDETGHTWQHSDEAIFSMTKYGRFPGEPTGRNSGMSPFKDRLSDHDILTAIAFIKAHWPLGMRVSQAMLNPGFAGMPRDADRVAWRLPPTCNAALRRRDAVQQK
jgi:mono/diheme cytochrome c family protein